MTSTDESQTTGTLSRRAVINWSIGLTLLVEAVTVVLRFGFKLSSTEETASTVGVLTAGIRIHHSYIGIVMLIVAWQLFKRVRPARRLWVQWLLIAGWAMFMSDMIHHFLVLWPIEGSPQFDLTYG